MGATSEQKNKSNAEQVAQIASIQKRKREWQAKAGNDRAGRVAAVSRALAERHPHIIGATDGPRDNGAGQGGSEVAEQSDIHDSISALPGGDIPKLGGDAPKRKRAKRKSSSRGKSTRQSRKKNEGDGQSGSELKPL